MKKSNLSILLVTLGLFLGLLFSFQLFSEQSLGTEPAVILPYTSSNEDVVAVKLFTEEKSVKPGKTFWVAVQFNISRDWHLYWKNPGDSGAPPTISWHLPPGFTVGEALWPFPDRYEIDGFVVYGYSREAIVLFPIQVPDEVKMPVQLAAEVEWLACSKSCVPGTASFSLQLPVAKGASELSLASAAIFRKARRWLPVESELTKAFYQNGMIDIELFPKMALESVKSVEFFPEEKESINTHIVPSWQLYEGGKKIAIQIQDNALVEKKVTLPIKGVLVIKEVFKGGVKNHAWTITVQEGEVEKKQLSQKASREMAPAKSENQKHIEELENKVWYRNILKSIHSISQSELFKIILLAFLGGIILNCMPCVLPVISMKLFQFVKLRDESKLALLKHALLYTFGILVSFWALALGIYFLQSLGHIVGWGFQLQEPLFVASLILILFILSLGLCGLFEFGVTIASKAGELTSATRRETVSYSGSFFSGILATFIATPCTGPLLGSAIGLTATLEPIFSFIIFSSLGLGMAFPFLLVSVVPGVSKLIPRPGRWMVSFKQLMGFFMLATVLWLIWVLEAETAQLSLMLTLITLLVVSFGVWVYGNWGGYERTKNTRIIAMILALGIVGWGSYIFLHEVWLARNASSVVHEALSGHAANISWERFTIDRLAALREKKVPVFVAVTAKWCLTCHANHAILDLDQVENAFTRYGVIKLVADWTTGDEEITKYIRSLGRNGVPLYAVYGRDATSQPVVLPEVVTPDIVIDALREAAIAPNENK